MPPQTASGVVVGTVALLRRFPLRSAGGDEPRRVLLGPRGPEHDRRWQLVDAAGSPVHRREAPGLAALVASVDDDGGLVVAGGAAGRGAGLRELAGQLGGPGARFADGAGAPGGGGREPRPDAAVHLVSAGAADAALDAEGALPEGCDPGERANAVLALDLAAAAPGAERGWTGRRLRVGTAVLLLTRTPRRCLGVYADVVVPGEVAVGDLVVLLDG